MEYEVSHVIFMYHRAREGLQFVLIMELAGDHTLIILILASLRTIRNLYPTMHLAISLCRQHMNSTSNIAMEIRGGYTYMI